MTTVKRQSGGSGRGVFVDTSAWVAFFLRNEEHHELTVSTFDRLAEASRLLITTDYVMAEAVTLLRVRGGLTIADRAWQALEDGDGAELVEVDAAIRARARDILRRHGHLVLSLTDCVSFAVMKELQIGEALTFDSDFRKAGFTILPGQPRR